MEDSIIGVDNSGAVVVDIVVDIGDNGGVDGGDSNGEGEVVVNGSDVC